MLLIAEILLTIFAWRKGWKWLALLPIGICLVLGFLVGFVIGASGGYVDDASGMGMVLDLIAIVVLIIMVVKGPKTKQNSEPIN